METFSKYAQVKDIRMIKDKFNGSWRDFAFVEFFTIEDANMVMSTVKKDPLKINGVQVFVTYSRLKKGDVSQAAAAVVLQYLVDRAFSLELERTFTSASSRAKVLAQRECAREEATRSWHSRLRRRRRRC